MDFITNIGGIKMNPEDKKNIDIANCRICTLCQNHCADCPLNWTLKLIIEERVLALKNELFHIEIFEIPLNLELPEVSLNLV